MLTQVLDIREGQRSLLKEVVIVFCASLLIALFAQGRIPLPFTPVPITLQSQIVLCLAVLLGSRRAVLATLAYLAQGLAGMPVFAGAVGGAAILAGPTGGYILGYIVAAFITGVMVERASKKSPSNVLLAMGTGTSVILLLGAIQLSTFIGLGNALLLGVVPFLIGDFIVKIGINLKVLQFMKWFQR